MNVTLPTVAQILFIHDYLIERTGGAHGIRDIGLLESAVARPHQGYGDHELFPDLHTKVAALTEGIIRNHAFIDGNKRTGLATAGIALELNGWELVADNQEALSFAYRIAEAHPEFAVIHQWLVAYSVSRG